MNGSTAKIIIVPAELVESVRSGLYIEESAAAEELRRNPLTGGQAPSPYRYQRVSKTMALLAVIGP